MTFYVRLPRLLGALAATVVVALSAAEAIAQPAASTSQELALPESEEGVPGVGPIRNEAWFVKVWNERRAAFAEHAADDRGAVVFFGDSIMQLWADGLDAAFSGVKIANRGISGDTTRGLLIRAADDVLALDPKAIVLLIGTNDLDVGVAPADIAGNIKLLLDQIAAHDPNTPVILCLVFPSSEKKHRPADKIIALNRELQKVARGNLQVTVLDTHKLFDDGHGNAKPEEFPDLLHPNELGYAKFRSALWPLLATAGLVEVAPDDFQVEQGFRLLFNGRDLTGWGYRPTDDADRATIARWSKGDPNMPPWPIVVEPIHFEGLAASSEGRFRAINGRLVVTTPTEGRRVQKLLTTADFPGDFELRLQFRASPNADSGVYLRGKQLQCRDYTLAGPYTSLKSYKPQDWNDLVVAVNGNKAHCTVNGEVVEAAYELPDSGPIGVEGDRGQMEYRRIRIKHDTE